MRSFGHVLVPPAGRLSLRRTAVAAAVSAVVASGLSAFPAPPAAAATPPAGSAGALDAAFGSHGIAAISVSGLSLTSVTKAIVQSDGRILVAGLQPGTASSVVVARLTSTGALDTTFGGKGYVKPGLGSTSTSDSATIALQPNGKILVGGSVQSGTSALAALMRLNSDGSTDTSFGTLGKVTTTVTGSPLVHVSDLALPTVAAPTGSIVASVWGGSSSNLTLLRYTAAGALDKTFGSNGVANVTTAGGVVEGQAVAVTSDGHLVEAGMAKVSSQNDTAIARFNANGTPDTTWPSAGNKTGAETLDLSGKSTADQANDVVLDSAGNILVSGSITDTPNQAYVTRLTAGGTLDSGYASSGILRSTYDGVTANGGALAIDGNGRLLEVGGSAASGTATNALGVERLTTAGAFDPAFGVQGAGSTASGTGRESIPCATGTGAATGVALQSNAQIIVAGSCNGVLDVARLNTGNLSNLTMSTSTPTAAAGHGTIPLGSVPTSALQTTSVAAASGFDSPSFVNPSFVNPSFVNPSFVNPSFVNPSFVNPSFVNPSFPTPVDASPLIDPAISQLPLSLLPMTPSTAGGPQTWNDVLAGTPYQGAPLQSVTLAQVLALGSPNPLDSVSLGQLDISATALRNVSLASYLLGTTSTSSLPAPSGGFCNYLQTQPTNCSNDSNVASQSLLDLELAGDNFQSYYTGTPINLVGRTLSNSPLPYTPLTNIDMSVTTLGATKTTQLTTPSQFVSCTPTTTAGQCDTLASAQAANAIRSASNADLGHLLSGSPAAVGSLSLINLIAGLVQPENLPIETLDQSGINAVYANSPMPKSGAAYSIGFDLGCDVASSLVVTPTLPTGFRLIPSTVNMTLGTGSSATNVPLTIGSDGSLRPTNPPACSGTQHGTINLQAEPGVDLTDAPVTANVTASVSTDTLTLTNQAGVQVVDNFEPDSSSNPTAATFDSLYVGHIAHSGDVDYYSLSLPPALTGSTLNVSLSHLPTDKDYDLVLYGPPAQVLRPQPGSDGAFGLPSFVNPSFVNPSFVNPSFVNPSGDGSATFGNSGSATPSTPDSDVPILSGQPTRAFSIQRGSQSESLSTKISDADTASGAAPFLIQVSGYNGASDNKPYVLRISVTRPAGTLPCAAPTPPFAGQGTANPLPSTPLPSSTQTLILVNSKRIGDYYGAGAEQALMTKLNQLASSSSVNGVVVPVEGDSATASAFSSWDANACSVSAANTVVYDINALVDNLRQHSSLHDLRYVVLVGSDQLLPMGRVVDNAGRFSEASYTGSVLEGKDNPESKAARSGYILSDNPYGDLAPTPYLGNELYVGQLAVGRLVETPDEIGSSIDAFLNAGGVTTPGSAFVTGYSPFDKGSTAVANTLSQRVPTTALVDATPPWSATDVQNGVAANAHGFLDINAHYDNYRLLSEQEFVSGNTNPQDPYSTASLPAPPGLSGSVAWTIGCHAGLNLPDIYLANPTQAEQAQLLDWSQALMQRGSTGYAASTGYGLGDTDAIAYSERLSGLFAQNLDGSMTIGQALAFAKQQYAAQLASPGVYDAKAIEEMTFYGLPMWRLGANGRSAPVTLPTATSTPSSVTTATSTVTFDSSRTGMAFSAGAPATRGSYFLAGGQAPLVVPNQPIEPQFVFTLPQRSDGLVAKGAIIEQLSSRDIPNFSPNFDTVVADNAGFSPEPAVTTADFPSRLQTVSGYVDGTGRHDSLVLVPGQYVTDGPGTAGPTQRLFDNVTATVISSNSPNTNAPSITSVTSAIQGTSATVTISTPDTDVVRGVALVLVGSSSTLKTDWKHVELVNDHNGHWVGTLTVPAGTTIGSYFGQLQDSDGNVSVSSNKGSDWKLSTGSAFAFSISGPDGSTPTPDQNGLYPDGTRVTITPPAGLSSYTVTLDGTTTTYSGTQTPTLTISGNGGHVLLATGNTGVSGSIGIPIDSTPPTFNVTSPTSGGSYAKGSTVNTQFSCSGNGQTIESCTGPSTIDTSTGGTHTVTFTAVDNYGKTWTFTVTYTVVDAPPTVTLTSTPSDPSPSRAGSIGWKVGDPDDPVSSLLTACTLDGTAVACGGFDSQGNGSTAYSNLAPTAQAHTFSITVTDSEGKSGTATFSWHVSDAAPAVSITSAPADPTDATAGQVNWQLSDADDSLGSLTTTCTLDGTVVACGGANGSGGGSTLFSNLTPQTAAHTFSITVTDPWGKSSTQSTSWHVYYRTTTKPAPAVPNVPLNAKVTRVTGNVPVQGVVVDFYLGQSPSATSASVCSATTDSTGTATCSNILVTASAITANGLTAKVRPAGVSSTPPPAFGDPSTFGTQSVPPYFISYGTAGVAGG